MLEKSEPKAPVNPVNHSLVELFKTEETYRNKLIFLVDVFSRSGLIGTNPVLNKFKQLLPRLVEISMRLDTNVTEGLKISQKIAAGETISIEEQETLDSLRDQRQQLLIKYFVLYAEYATNYGAFQKQAGNPKAFKALKDYVYASNKQGFCLSDYLIEPVQRGPRYDILIKNVIEYNQSAKVNPLVKLNDKQIEQFQKMSAHIRYCASEANKATPEMTQAEETIPTEESGYKFGDISRAGWAFAGQAAQKGFGLMSVLLSSPPSVTSSAALTSVKENINDEEVNSLADEFENLYSDEEISLDDFQFLGEDDMEAQNSSLNTPM
ncbi:RhoGEF domain protein [Legionella quinlivanii]|uniref:RhoGEF domain protein n=1 Tax=Legionella quinlivanii TaxID=45073 RepID=A0A0W0Y0R1_9GAMM|nr:RhoGEF domain-containing protein [Legionella quinlivanii]KTD50142.1 RhoGEF domain protein [Legionella quinlivanii]MCW8450113.1 RhoGEF domain-containing protein [Legionella quinlivanii]SEF49693.1 RhoGEF domain-containing protein [Legionella quinlivanii DSM 21216]STY11740.1 RhoGEF domain [Legionella quinlivanii]